MCFLAGNLMGMSKIICLVSMLTFFSCGVVKINNTNYYKLTAKELDSIHPFSQDDAQKVYSYKDSCVLQKISYRDIALLSKKYKCVWLHFFSPWCTSESCTNLQQYINFAKEAGGDLRLVLVSNSYDYAAIKTVLQGTDYNHVVYVLDNEAYSENITHANRLFFHQINAAKACAAKSYASDYLLRSDSLLLMKDWDKSYAAFYDSVRARLKQ